MISKYHCSWQGYHKYFYRNGVDELENFIDVCFFQMIEEKKVLGRKHFKQKKKNSTKVEAQIKSECSILNSKEKSLISMLSKSKTNAEK